MPAHHHDARTLDVFMVARLADPALVCLGLHAHVARDAESTSGDRLAATVESRLVPRASRPCRTLENRIDLEFMRLDTEGKTHGRDARGTGDGLQSTSCFVFAKMPEARPVIFQSTRCICRNSALLETHRVEVFNHAPELLVRQMGFHVIHDPSLDDHLRIMLGVGGVIVRGIHRVSPR